MKYKPPKFTDRELLQIFPEARAIIPIKIQECKTAIQEKEHEIATLLNKIYLLETDEFSEWFGEELVKKLIMPELSVLDKRLFRLNHLEYLSSSKKKGSGRIDFGEKIVAARAYPIVELAGSKMNLRLAGRNFVSLCPFHNEKHASFYLYPETNTFHCYGCGNHGDVISLTMALCGVDFKDAVAMLQY